MLLSPQGDKKYITDKGLKHELYRKNMMQIKQQISQLKTIPKQNITEDQIWGYRPTVISMDGYPNWIKNKFRLVANVTGRDMPFEGEEWRFFSTISTGLYSKTHDIEDISGIKAIRAQTWKTQTFFKQEIDELRRNVTLAQNGVDPTQAVLDIIRQ